MIKESSDNLSNLPGRATWGGYVYVLSFDNGTVKVGSTANPRERIRIHQTSAAQFGVAILDLWVSPEILGHIRAEKRLIGAASHMSTGATLREWFHGVDFRALVEVAQAITRPNPEGQQTAPSVPVDLWTIVKEALGVDTNAQAAARCGVSLSTLDRLYANPESSLLRNALKVSAATGISLDDIVSGTKPRQLSEAA